MAKTKTEEKNISDNFFNDFSLNFTNYAETIETAASIQQQQRVLDERTNAWKQSAQQLVTVQRLLGNPYFAGLIFRKVAKSRRRFILASVRLRMRLAIFSSMTGGHRLVRFIMMAA